MRRGELYIDCSRYDKVAIYLLFPYVIRYCPDICRLEVSQLSCRGCAVRIGELRCDVICVGFEMSAYAIESPQSVSVYIWPVWSFFYSLLLKIPAV